MADDIKFEDNSKAAKEAMNKAIEAALTKIGMVIVSEAKDIITLNGRVDTGAMRDKTSYKLEHNPNESKVIIGNPLTYAIYNEFGTGEYAENGLGRKGGWGYTTPDGKEHFTHGMKPKPFLRPAYKVHKKNVEKILAQFLENTFVNMPGGK